MPKSPAIDCGGLNVLVDAKHGRMLVNRHDVYIGRSLIELGEFSEGEVDLFRQVLPPGGVVVEAGANMGAHTVPLARLVGPAGRVFAFEPQRIIFQLLCANVALNSLTNVQTYWSAVGDVEGELLVPEMDYARANNFGGLGLEGRTSGEKVPLRTIDSLQLARLNLLKADVEGMEQAVLAGARQTIERCRPLLYVENDRTDKSAQLLALVKGSGYRAFAHAPPLYSANNYFQQPSNPFGNIISMNIFAVHTSVAADIQGLQEL